MNAKGVCHLVEVRWYCQNTCCQSWGVPEFRNTLDAKLRGWTRSYVCRFHTTAGFTNGVKTDACHEGSRSSNSQETSCVRPYFEVVQGSFDGIPKEKGVSTFTEHSSVKYWKSQQFSKPSQKSFVFFPYRHSGRVKLQWDWFHEWGNG